VRHTTDYQPCLELLCFYSLQPPHFTRPVRVNVLAIIFADRFITLVDPVASRGLDVLADAVFAQRIPWMVNVQIVAWSYKGISKFLGARGPMLPSFLEHEINPTDRTALLDQNSVGFIFDKVGKVRALKTVMSCKQ